MLDTDAKGLIPEAREYEGLKDSGAWLYLKRAVEGYEKRVLAALTRRLWSGQEVDPKEIAHTRGFYEGALFVVSHPEQVQDDLMRAAASAWQRYLEDQVTEDEESKPYA